VTAHEALVDLIGHWHSKGKFNRRRRTTTANKSLTPPEIFNSVGLGSNSMGFTPFHSIGLIDVKLDGTNSTLAACSGGVGS